MGVLNEKREPSYKSAHRTSRERERERGGGGGGGGGIIRVIIMQNPVSCEMSCCENDFPPITFRASCFPLSSLQLIAM